MGSHLLAPIAPGMLLLAAAASQGQTGQVRSTTLAVGFDGPVAVAAVEGPEGAEQLYVAEAGAGRVTRLLVRAGIVLERSIATTLPPPAPGALSPLRGLLLVAGSDEGVSMLKREDAELSTKVVDPTPIVGPLATNSRVLIAVTADGLARWRSVGSSLAPMNRPPPWTARPVAMTFSPEGYLVAVTRDAAEEGGWSLAFLDPSAPTKPLSVTMLRGVGEVAAIAYANVDRQATSSLYLLDSAPPTDGDAVGSGALVRLDAALTGSGQPSAVAVPVADAPEPRAMTIGPSGTLYIVGGVDDGGWLLAVTLPSDPLSEDDDTFQFWEAEP